MEDLTYELRNVRPCADQVTFACEGVFHGCSLSDLERTLQQAGYRTTTLPDRGTLVARRNAQILMADSRGEFTLSRLDAAEDGQTLLDELVRLH